ncbi:MAG: hypothetical protein AB1505_28640 [Candidatus Latescibacterota bacterium]
MVGSPPRAQAWQALGRAGRTLLVLGGAGVVALGGLLLARGAAPWWAAAGLARRALEPAVVLVERDLSRQPGDDAGLRARRARVALPPVSLLWRPARPQPGEALRVEAAGASLDTARAVALHHITDPSRPVDYAVPMERRADAWQAVIAVPAEAAALFLYAAPAGPSQAPPFTADPWSPPWVRDLRRYDRSLPLCDPHGRPVRDAEYLVAEMALVAGRPFPEVARHLQREVDVYPNNVRAHNEVWFHRLRTDPAAEAAVRAEQRALLAAYADQPAVLFQLARVAGPALPEAYAELRQRFPGYQGSDGLGYLWARYLGMEGDLARQTAALEELIDAFPESPYVPGAYLELLGLLSRTDPARAESLAAALISGTLRPGGPAAHPLAVEATVGAAWRLRFRQHLLEGSLAGARDVTQALLAAGLRDPQSYWYIGRRLAGAPEPWQEWLGAQGHVVCILAGLAGPEEVRAALPPAAHALRVALDDGSVYERYQPAYGTLYLIDADGKLRLRREWRGERTGEVEGVVEGLVGAQAERATRMLPGGARSPRVLASAETRAVP